MKLIIIGTIFMSTIAQAKPIKLPNEVTLRVIYQAAKRYNVNAQDLIKIAFLESSFKSNAIRKNSNNTIDYGMFQINSAHWTTTCKGMDIFKLQGNVGCAAKLLSKAKRHSKLDAQWLGRYHSKTPSLKSQYAIKLASLDLE